MNIWYQILQGLITLITNFLMWALPNPVAALDFASPVLQGFGVFLKLFYLFGSAFNLFWVGVFFLMMLIFAGIKIVMKLVATISGLIKTILIFFA